MQVILPPPHLQNLRGLYIVYHCIFVYSINKNLGQANGRTDERADGRTDERTDERTNSLTRKWRSVVAATNEETSQTETDKRRNGRTKGWRVGRESDTERKDEKDKRAATQNGRSDRW